MVRRSLFVLLLAGQGALSAAPAGWRLGGPGAHAYRAELDHQVKHGGKASARLSCAVTKPDAFGMLLQRVDAATFVGKRVRLSAYLRARGVAGWVGLWLRVDGRRQTLAVENTQDRAVRGDADWTLETIVLDVPSEAHRLTLGVSLEGPGSAWLDDLRLEQVDASVPLTMSALATRPKGPENLDLEHEGLAPWFLSGGAGKQYALSQVAAPVHGGSRALKLEPLAPSPEGYGVAIQLFSASRFLDKRVRISAFIKTEGIVARGDFWARVQAADSPDDGPGLSGASVALSPTADWTRYELVFDVPPDGMELQLGAGIQGPGRLYLDDAQVEIVDRSVPIAPAVPREPFNPAFEEN